MSKRASATPGAEYVHGTTEEEQNRLAGLNDITNNSFVDYLTIKGSESVCDVGVDREIVSSTSVDAVLAAMKHRVEYPVGVAHFHWNRVTAVKRA
jgi:hypothetical protein